MNDVGVPYGAHYLNFPPNPDEVGFRFNLALFNRLYCDFLTRLLVYSQLYLAVSSLTEFLDYVEPEIMLNVTSSTGSFDASNSSSESAPH